MLFEFSYGFPHGVLYGVLHQFLHSILHGFYMGSRMVSCMACCLACRFINCFSSHIGTDMVSCMGEKFDIFRWIVSLFIKLLRSTKNSRCSSIDKL